MREALENLDGASYEMQGKLLNAGLIEVNSIPGGLETKLSIAGEIELKKLGEIRATRKARAKQSRRARDAAMGSLGMRRVRGSYE